MTAPTELSISNGRKPLDEEIDVFGLTHPGRVRPKNDDHFLICSLHKVVRVHTTSLPSLDGLPLEGERLAFLGMVADGVGGQPGGSEASRRALESLTSYVASSMHCYHGRDLSAESDFRRALQEAVLAAHRHVLAAGEASGVGRMATTLTLVLAVWPRAFVVQVGDSRAYVLRGTMLERVTRDQTMAEALVEQGVLERRDAEGSRFAHMLTSAVGGSEILPVTSVIDLGWEDVLLLCSDGLTKHVPDERIRDALGSMRTAEQACRDLVEAALAGGGSDNVTVLIGRARRARA